MKNNDKNNRTIPAEIIPGKFHHKGALAAARQGDQINPERASSWCQFYIVQGKVYADEELERYEQQMNEGKKRGMFNQVIMKPENADLLSSGQEYQRGMRQAQDPAVRQKYMMQLDSITKLIMMKVEEQYEPTSFTQEQKESYTTEGGSPHLDNDYTVFGRVVEGLDVIDKLAAVETVGDKAKEKYYMTMEVEKLPKSKITKLYGYEYPEQAN